MFPQRSYTPIMFVITPIIIISISSASPIISRRSNNSSNVDNNKDDDGHQICFWKKCYSDPRDILKTLNDTIVILEIAIPIVFFLGCILYLWYRGIANRNMGNNNYIEEET